MSSVLTPSRSAPSASPARSDRLDRDLRIRDLEAPLGAEVIGLDLGRPISDEELAPVVRAHLDRGPLAPGAEHLLRFQGVPETLRMTGRNYGLRGLRYTTLTLVPSALPAILSGLRVGWAFAWRTLIAAELFFGASSGNDGLGWYIFQNRNELYTDRVFAGLATVILIGMLFENLVFESIERVTVRRWGVHR